MSIQDVTERVHSLGNAWEQFKQVNDARLHDLERKGHADPLYSEHLAKINEAIDNQKSRLDQIETANARPGASLGGSPVSGEVASEYKSAFRNYLRKGMDAGLETLQTKALSSTNADGGYLITPEMSETIVQIVNEISPMRELARVETISTDSLDVIEDDELPGASWVAETAARLDTTTHQINKNTITVHEMYASPKATQKLIDDASIDVEEWVARRVAEKFAALEATSFIAGDGSGKPRGILDYAAGTTFGTEIEQVQSGTDAVVTADSLIQLYYALKEEYAKNATFLMNRTVLQSVRLLKEATTNQYLWTPGLAAGTPDNLLGVPVKTAADMPVAADTSLSVAIADFKQAYLIVDRVGVRILRDPFTDKPYVKFYTTKRVGGEVVNTDAIKLLSLTDGV
jgi:HK97 family phage major capsid protein